MVTQTYTRMLRFICQYLMVSAQHKAKLRLIGIIFMTFLVLFGHMHTKKHMVIVRDATVHPEEDIFTTVHNTLLQTTNYAEAMHICTEYCGNLPPPPSHLTEEIKF